LVRELNSLTLQLTSTLTDPEQRSLFASFTASLEALLAHQESSQQIISTITNNVLSLLESIATRENDKCVSDMLEDRQRLASSINDNEE
jgi:hypothetical protein